MVKKVAQKPLLSANTCQKLNLLTVNTEDANKVVHMANEVVGGLTKEQILADYSYVFTAPGQFPGEYHIEVDQTLRPVQHQPWCVVVALKVELKEKRVNGETIDSEESGRTNSAVWWQ